MVCIYCSNATNITNSRHLNRSNGTWRRRNCSICGVTFSSIESPDYSSAWVVSKKHSKALEPFNFNKLYISIYESLKHREKAIIEAEHLTNTIINSLSKIAMDGYINIDSLQNEAFNVLDKFDNIGALHYKAYYQKD